MFKTKSLRTSHTANNLWILKNFTNLLASSAHLGVLKATSIQTLDFSTLHNSIRHNLLKSRMNNIQTMSLKWSKNGATRHTHIKVGRYKSYFTNDTFNGNNKYTANDICKMTDYFMDNVYVKFARQLFLRTIGIAVGTNCAPLLVDLFLYSYEN